MAGAEFKITDKIQDSILTKLKGISEELGVLDNKFKEASKSYADLAEKLAAKINGSPGSLEELSKKSKEYEQTVKKLHDTQNELADLQQKYKESLKQVNEVTKQAVRNAQEDAKAKKLNAEAELRLEKAQTERIRQQKLLNQEQKKQKLTTEQAIQLAKQEVHSIAEAEAVNKQLRQAVKDLTDAEDKEGKIRQQLNSAINQNTNYIKRNRDAYVQAKMTVGDYKEQIKLAIVELKNGNDSMKNFGIVAKGFGGIIKTSIADGTRQVASNVGSMIKGFVGAQAVITGIQRLIGAFKQGINTAIDFEAANSKLAAILGTTRGEIKDLTSDARRLGETTKYTASEATNLQIELSKLGFSKTEILDMTEGVLKFAQATGAELPEAAALAGAALRMFGADTEETERYVSAMAVATTKSALSFSYLQTAMPIVGPVAKAFNFTIEDTLALLGKLADAGFDASMSATATRNILLNLADGSGKLAQALGGPVKTLPELVDGLKRLKEQGIDLNSTLEMTDKRSVAAFNAFLTASDKIVPLRDQITGVEDDLNKMADTMGNNVQGALYNLSSAWESLMLTIMGNTGAMKDFVDMATNGIRKINEWLMTTEQLAEKQVETAKRAASPYAEESIKSEIIAINRLKDEYLKAGDDETTALEKAKNERIAILEQELSKQQSLRNKFYNENQQLWKDMGDASFFKQALGLEKTNTEFSKEQTKTWNEYLDKVTKVTSLEKQIADIRAISNSVDETSKVSTALTDKQKKKLEKQRKELLRIDKEYQQSRLELMDEGLEKELAKIRLNYTQRIAKVKGNSGKENETRKNLAEKMQEEIANKEIDFYLSQEKKKLQIALDSVKEGSEEQRRMRMELIDLDEEAEVNAMKGNYENLQLVRKKYEKKRIEELNRQTNEDIRRMEDSASLQAEAFVVGLAERQNELEKSHLKGEMSEEKYKEDLYKLTVKYNKEMLLAQISAAEAELKLAEETGTIPQERIDELRLKLRKLRADFDSLANDEMASESEKGKKKVEEWEEALKGITDAFPSEQSGFADFFSGINDVLGDLAKKAQEAGGSFSDMWANMSDEERLKFTLEGLAKLSDGLNSMMQNIYENRISKIEEEQEANEEAGEQELARIERLEETGAISSEEAEARKRAAEDKTARKNEELEKKKAQLQQKQARWDKANSIIQATIATALAVAKALPNFVLAGIAAAMGAAQIAVIASQPIPKYAKGTDSHKGGLAVVGDGGVPETVITDNGAYITPSVPTLVDIPRGAKVIPYAVDMERMMAHASDFDGLMAYRSENNLPPISIVNDYSELEKEIKSLKKSQQIGFARLAMAIKENNYQQFSKKI